MDLGRRSGRRALGVPRRFLVGAICAALVATACSPQPSPEVVPSADAVVTSLEVAPAGVFLAGVGKTRQLTALARTADGRVVDAEVSWSSTDTTIVTIDAVGTVSATAIGTAKVVAALGDIRSAPAYVTVARPVAGAILLSDAQIVSGPTLTDPSGEPAADAPYEVVLRGVASPAPGAILINAESLPVAGRVVSAKPEGDDVRVRLVVVPPGELFDAVAFEDTVDLGEGPFEIPDELAAAYDVVQTGSSFEFTPKVGATSVVPGDVGSAALARWVEPPDTQTPAIAVGAQGTSALPPLPPFSECEGEAGMGSGMPVPLAISAPPTFSFTAAGSVTREATADGTQIVVQATPTFTFLTALEVKAAFEGTYSCKLTLATKKFRVPGWAGLFFGGDVNFGVGFQIGGKVTLLSAKLGGTVEIKPTFEATLTCSTDDDCVLGGDADASATVKPVWTVPSLDQVAFEPSVGLFGFIALQAGNADIERLQFDAIEAKAGLELAASLTLEGLQISNTGEDGRSKYGLAFKGEVGPGIKFGKFLEYLGLKNVVPLKLGFEVALGASPTGTVKADRPRYLPGEPVGVKVKLASTVFPVVGFYNVKKVAIVRRDGLSTMTLAEQAATDGQTEFEFAFDSPGLLDAGELFAFVVTSILPLDPPKLEIGPAAAPILFTFDNDLEGWDTFGIGPRSQTQPWGQVEWRLGAARISGVGGPGKRNSAIFRSFALPADATTLTFKASADLGHAHSDSRLTVRIVADDASTTLLTKVYSNTTSELLFTEESLDISTFAGKTVVIYFEQDDNGPGEHEHIYLDDIAIHTAE